MADILHPTEENRNEIKIYKSAAEGKSVKMKQHMKILCARNMFFLYVHKSKRFLWHG